MANTYRELLARAIESNGGYSRGYGERFALSFNVALYYANLDVDHIYALAVKEFGELPPLTPAFEWDANYEWECGQKFMAQSLADSDCYKTYSPDTAKRYGMPYHTSPWIKYWRKRKPDDTSYYPAKVPGWIIVNPYCNESYDVEFGLYGRGGKHLCIEAFEGVRMDMSADDLAYAIRNDEAGDYSNKWCQRLLAMMAEWEQCFTPEAASAELEYQCASSLYWKWSEQ